MITFDHQKFGLKVEKKRTAGGPPDFARRAPLGRRGRRVLRTMIIKNHANTVSMHVVTHGGVLGARAPRDFRVRGGDLRGVGGEFFDFQNHEKGDVSCVKIGLKLIWNDLG